MEEAVSEYRVARIEDERVLESMARAFAEARGLAFKVVPMTDGPELRIGLGFYPSGRLRDVAVRLSCRSTSVVRAVTQLPVADASPWGEARAMTIYRMRSETVLPWPIEQPVLVAFLERAVEQARRTRR